VTSDHDEFLRKDYELKISYLIAHLGRMWTRFNFFVTVESGLVAGLVFTRDGGGFTTAAVYFAAAEAVLSAIWWIFGAQDRYLVESYRDAVKQAAERLDGRDTFPRYVGDPARERRYVSLFEWRSDGISITRLAAIVPFVLLVFWLSVAVLLALR
jgi:hypothetical protein